MNKFVYKLICIALLMVVAVPVSMAAEITSRESSAKDNSGVVQTESKSTFKGLLYRVWGKLRALNPTVKKRSQTVVTAGVRGAETTESLIEPYWKGDKTEDPSYIKELTEYTKAQQLAEGGDLQGAVKALSAFIDTHKDSDLKPNAQFALGISYGGLGQNQSSVSALQAFVADNPGHPLLSDAQQVIAELK